MAVFKFTAESETGEGVHETGYIVASDKLDAYDKLRRQGYDKVRLKREQGLAAFVRGLTADVR